MKLRIAIVAIVSIILSLIILCLTQPSLPCSIEQRLGIGGYYILVEGLKDVHQPELLDPFEESCTAWLAEGEFQDTFRLNVVLPGGTYKSILVPNSFLK